MAIVLVADDEEGVRSFVAEALETAGHRVIRAADGDEAARLLDARSFHLLVTDLKMPGLDGMALLRKVEAEQPETEGLVLTAHGSVDGAVEATKLGALDCRLPCPGGCPRATPTPPPARCYTALVTIARDRAHTVKSRVARPGDSEPPDTDWEGSTPSERIDAVWELTRLCLAWNRDPDDEPRLQRSVSRVQRSWR